MSCEARGKGTDRDQCLSRIFYLMSRYASVSRVPRGICCGASMSKVLNQVYLHAQAQPAT
ncbi:hypothetical protein IG631_10401 [Alternaria alternata]|nr:hypothetical protein IG631_10401 [Alternaria alternata]